MMREPRVVRYTYDPQFELCASDGASRTEEDVSSTRLNLLRCLLLSNDQFRAYLSSQGIEPDDLVRAIESS
jgi:hypothetical protein